MLAASIPGQNDVQVILVIRTSLFFAFCGVLEFSDLICVQLLDQDPLKHKYIFSSSDMQTKNEAFAEFKARNKTINERIDETYRIGNQMTDYLEKQIILDHHFRGE